MVDLYPWITAGVCIVVSGALYWVISLMNHLV
jgi:hypothetical protein